MRVKSVTAPTTLRPCIFCSELLVRRLLAVRDRIGDAGPRMRMYSQQLESGRGSQDLSLKGQHNKQAQIRMAQKRKDENPEAYDRIFRRIRKLRVDAPEHRIWKYTARADFQPPGSFSEKARESFARSRSSEFTLNPNMSQAGGAKGTHQKPELLRETFRIHKHISNHTNVETLPTPEFKYVNRKVRIRKFVHTPLRREITEPEASPVQTTPQDVAVDIKRVSPRRRRARLFAIRAKETSRGTQGYRDHMAKRARIQEATNTFTKHQGAHPVTARTAAMATHKMRKSQKARSRNQKSGIRKFKIRRIYAMPPAYTNKNRVGYIGRRIRLHYAYPTPPYSDELVRRVKSVLRIRKINTPPPLSHKYTAHERLQRRPKSVIRRVIAAYLATPSQFRLSYFASVNPRDNSTEYRAPIVTQYIRALQRRSDYYDDRHIPDPEDDIEAPQPSPKSDQASFLDDISRLLTSKQQRDKQDLGYALRAVNRDVEVAEQQEELIKQQRHKKDFEDLLRRELLREKARESRESQDAVPVTATGRYIESMKRRVDGQSQVDAPSEKAE